MLTHATFSSGKNNKDRQREEGRGEGGLACDVWYFYHGNNNNEMHLFLQSGCTTIKLCALMKYLGSCSVSCSVISYIVSFIYFHLIFLYFYIVHFTFIRNY